MYSRNIIDAVLDDHEAKYGWRPVEHSLGEVDDFNEYIESILEVESNSVNRYYDIKPGVRISQKRVAEIRRWVENEQFMCFADAFYFQTRYAYICGVGDDIFRYRPRESQKVFHEIITNFDELQVAIEIFILKARQLGISTAVALYFLHRILFRSNTKAVMASVKQTQSDLLARIQDTCFSRLPFWLIPPKTSTKMNMPQWANGSILSIQSGSQAFGIAQGWTPSCIHISEVGDIPNPKKVLEEGLFRAAHSSASLFFAIEGTGNGTTGWQADKWRYYKENWGKGGRFCPIFIPPACASDLYPLPDWIQKNPVPNDFHPCEQTKRMQRKGELYIRSTAYLVKVMGSNWKMSREFLWYWDCQWREAVASKTEKVWLSQMPCTDEEALQGEHDIVFNDEVIEVTTNERKRTYQAYAITGKTILIGTENEPYHPSPSDIDYEKDRIPLHWESPDGNKYDWELVPLLPFDDSEDPNCFDKLFVFHPPVPGCEYSIGVDCADGLGMPNEDRSNLNVNIGRTGKERDEQVAEFTSVRVNSPQMARIAACVGAYYGSEAKHPLGCKFAIEQRRKPGDECQHQLKIMGFYRHHEFVMYDSKGMPDPSKAHKEGWFTNVWSRPMLLNKYVDAFNSGWLKVNSPILLRQMKTFVRKEKEGISEMIHESGAHDDNIFGLAMAFFTLHDMENNALRYAARYQSIESELQVVNLEYPTLAIALP